MRERLDEFSELGELVEKLSTNLHKKDDEIKLWKQKYQDLSEINKVNEELIEQLYSFAD